ncbi:hypothetical protein HJC23_012563 [Cyclotella cryptica]|uniref:Uncharacterized protein n=1 Tax=Cyclotella cryptica TaxID=29204 RepID=A0ABD3QRB8_9STRA|eukprot:CCRYP_003229-RA/>CCRYP_003229-RA protein AED:0.46 eAED:0.46 QI:0/-1/0/1/-1/1/1/0/154
MNSFRSNTFNNANGFAIDAKYSHINKSTKRVSFSETSLMILVEPKTMEESIETWYTPKDMETFRRDKRDEALQLIESGGTEVMEYLIHYIVKGRPLTAIEECGLCLGYFCGLETAVIHRVGKSLLSMRAATRELVLSEQARQRVMNETNTEQPL